MAITDWASLKAAVQNEAARTDTTFSNKIEDFVSRAEERIYHGVGNDGDPLYSAALRSNVMSTATTVSITSGSGPVPSSCLGIRVLDRDGDRIGLDYLSPEELRRRNEISSSGNPRWYSVEGASIKTAPDGYTGNLNILYFAKPTGISASNTTNAVLTAHPSIYLHATLYAAFKWLRDQAMAGDHLSELRAIISGINASETAVRHGGGKLTAKPRRVIGE
jgi:hypothetical protein